MFLKRKRVLHFAMHDQQYRCYGGSWFNHILEWWEAAQADPDHVLFLRYEDMLKTPEEHIRKIADFTGIPHTPDIISKVCDINERIRSNKNLIFLGGHSSMNFA